MDSAGSALSAPAPVVDPPGAPVPSEVLLADDDTVTTLVIRRLLQKAGYRVTSVVNGQQALEILSARHVPFVLTDWEMPEIDGPALCRHIRGLSHGGYVYTVLLTARTSRDHILAGLESGADDYLTKPVDEAELLARLKTGQRILDLERRLRAANEQALLISVTDALTEVYNRRHFMAEMPKELERAHRFDTATSLVLLDVDHFKRINDELGHQMGDDVLKVVASTLKAAVRPNIDWIARVGGEEFVVVLPGTDHNGALVVAERLRQSLAAQAISTPKGPLHATASFGVATAHSTWPAEMTTTEQLLAQSDMRMYASKRSGRNRVTGQEDPAVS